MTVDYFDRVVEGIAVGSRSPLALPGPLSWLEREIHDFARYLDRRLNGPPAQIVREAAE